MISTILSDASQSAESPNLIHIQKAKKKRAGNSMVIHGDAWQIHGQSFPLWHHRRIGRNRD